MLLDLRFASLRPRVNPWCLHCRNWKSVRASGKPIPMVSVFLSYRRDDSVDVTGRIYDYLVRELGEVNVFKDIDSLMVGLDFREQIQSALQRCDVFLAIIGPGWLNAHDDAGNRRLDKP